MSSEIQKLENLEALSKTLEIKEEEKLLGVITDLEITYDKSAIFHPIRESLFNLDDYRVYVNPENKGIDFYANGQASLVNKVSFLIL